MEILPFHLLTCGFSIIESKWSLSLGQGHMWADNLQNNGLWLVSSYSLEFLIFDLI